MFIFKNCIFCNSNKLKLLHGYEKMYLCKCGNCDLVFSIKIPKEVELDNYYKSYGVSNYLSPLTIKRYNELLDEFEPFRKTNKILDIGCGIGYFLVEAKKRGWEVHGTEISEESFDICKKKEINIKKGLLDQSNYNPEMFDVITSFEVIEHINNPNNELSVMNSILRKGGMVYLTTPNFNSLLRYRLKVNYNIFVYPEHLTFYTPITLNNIFSHFGFEKLKIETTGFSLTRLRISSGLSNQMIISAHSDDEKIRNHIDNNFILKFTKKIINKFFTSVGVGDSLKGTFIKKA